MIEQPAPIEGRDGSKELHEFLRQVRRSVNRLNVYRSVTVTDSATWSDRVLNATSGTFTITLPTAVGHSGDDFIVKNSGAGVITMAGTNGQTFDGVASPAIAAGGSRTFVSDGANWIVVSSV